MEEQKNSYNLIAKLDTEGDILLGITKEQRDSSSIAVTITTPNHEENSQLFENLLRMAKNQNSYSIIHNDGHSFSFEVEKQNGVFDIILAGHSILQLDEEWVPLNKEGATTEVILSERINAATKTRLAQKTDYEPTLNDESTFSPGFVERSKGEASSIQIGKTDLHNHLSGLLPPNRLIALGVRHNVDYDILLLQKYDIDISKRPGLMRNLIEQVAKIPIIGENNEIIVPEGGYISKVFFDKLNEDKMISNEEMIAEYKRILDLIRIEKIPKKPLESVAIPFNDIITIPGNLEKISLSMRLPIEGQAVFTNLEEVYDARNLFTKNNGRVVNRGENDTKENPIVPSHLEIEEVFERLQELSSYEAMEVCAMLSDMQNVQNEIERNKTTPEGISERFRNGLQEDMHLWIGIEAKRGGVEYIETSQAALAKKNVGEGFLHTVTGEPNVLKYIEEKTGTAIRYLAAIRRNFDSQAEFDTAAETVIRSAKNDYCVGVDFMGEELNETNHFSKTITDIARYVIEEDPQFVIRVHAGENNANSSNIEQVIDAVDRAFVEEYSKRHNVEDVPRRENGEIDFSKIDSEEISYPQIRIGHGLYGPVDNEKLMKRMADRGVIVEFNISSNIRLNNIQPGKVIESFQKLINAYDNAGVGIVFGTDGYGIYGTSTREEVKYAEALGLFENTIDIKERIQETEKKAMSHGMGREKRNKEHSYKINFEDITKKQEISEEVKTQIARKIAYGEGKIAGAEPGSLEPDIDIFEGKKPIVIAGGSFGTDVHSSDIRASYQISDEDKKIIDEIIKKSDPEKVVFVIGHTGAAQEGYLLKKLEEMSKNGDSKKFEVIAVMPTIIKGNDDGEFLTQTEGEINDIKSAFEVAQNPLIKGIITDGASREGTSIYKVFQKRVFNKQGATLVAFEGEAPLANLIQEARNTGARILGRVYDDKETIITDKADAFGEGSPTNSKGQFTTFGIGEFKSFIELCDKEVSVEERKQGMEVTGDLKTEEILVDEQKKGEEGKEF